MTKHRWKGTMKALGNHLDPEKEDQLKWVKIEISNKVRRILKLAKNMNPSSKDGNLKKRAELINLVEDFHQQYDSLYSLYGDLKVEVKKNVKGGDEDAASSASSSDSETFYSPGGSNVVSSNVSKASESEASDFEDTILKDKLTSTSEVKKSVNMDSVSSYNKPPEFREIVEDLRIPEAESEETRQRLSEIKDLEKEIASLKLENVNVFTQKQRLEEEVARKSNEVVQMKETVSKLKAHIVEIEAKSKETECRFSSLKKEKAKADKLQALVDTLKLQKSELEEKLSHEANERTSADKLQALVDTLKLQKSELEEKLSHEANERTSTDKLQALVDTLKLQKSEVEEKLSNEENVRTSRVDGLLERVESLEKELVTVKSSKAECEMELKRKSEAASECLLQIETLRNELTSHTLETQRMTTEKGCTEVRVKDLELEIQSLSSNKRDLEELMKKTRNEASQSDAEKKKLHDQVKALENKVETLQNERKRLSVELDSLLNEKMLLETEVDKEKRGHTTTKSQMEKKNNELTNKVADQQKTMLELGDAMNKIKDEKGQVQVKFADPKSNLHLMERKIEEMADEFRKQFEDKYRILSRRIRVAEQLHVENKEWYIKTKESYEQQNKELKLTVDNSKLGFKNVKDITLAANDVLTSLDTVSLKFEECSGNFLNRISKASCELKFAKDWARRKNKALLHVKDEFDCLLRQLDDKEAEILVYREKVWKSENKVRELEKMIKEKDDGMLGLEEEKREAIRQLCVWIDYHRSRSDYYKKIMSEMNPGRRKA